jgi:hypothetical protein
MQFKIRGKGYGEFDILLSTKEFVLLRLTLSNESQWRNEREGIVCLTWLEP